MTKSQNGWKKRYTVHPAADLFPMMSDDELDKLAEDIKAHGLRSPMVFWRDENDQPVLIDGRNRAAALEKIGDGLPLPGSGTTITGDPVSFVMSANVRRRHLTRAQKREAIKRLLKLAPERSDRQIAKDAQTDHKTVGKVRKQAESTGEVPQTTTRIGKDGRTRKGKPKRKAAPVEITRSDGSKETTTSAQLKRDAAKKKAEALKAEEATINEAILEPMAKPEATEQEADQPRPTMDVYSGPPKVELWPVPDKRGKGLRLTESDKAIDTISKLARKVKHEQLTATGVKRLVSSLEHLRGVAEELAAAEEVGT